MKKAEHLLVFTLFLFMLGCGGGGGTTATTGIPSDSGGGNGGGGSISGPVGYITVSFGQHGPTQSAPVAITPNGDNAVALEGGFRVAVSKTVLTPATDEEGNPILVKNRTYIDTKDNTIPGSITIAAPVDSGYLIEILTYNNIPSSPVHNMIRYGHLDNVSLIEGTNDLGTVTLSIITDSITFNAPSVITGGTSYSMTVSYDNVPLRDNFNFTENTVKSFVMDSTAPYFKNVSFQRTAPSGVANDNIYFQGQFYLWDSMLNKSEISSLAWKKYRLNAPASYNNDMFQKLFMPATIIIGF